MTGPVPQDAAGGRAGQELFVGLAAVVIAFAVSGMLSYLNTRMLSQNAEQVARTHEIISALEDVLSLMKDAETGQRGYLITGDARYLEPYTAAVGRVDGRLGELERLVRDDPRQGARLSTVRGQVGAKLRELEETIALRRSRGFEAARQVVESDRGKAAMDAVRSEVGLMQADERVRRAARLAEMENAYRVAVGSGVVTGLLGVLLSAFVAYLARISSLGGGRRGCRRGRSGSAGPWPATSGWSSSERACSGSSPGTSTPTRGPSSPAPTARSAGSRPWACRPATARASHSNRETDSSDGQCGSSGRSSSATCPRDT
jgi:CHASE3 domain sensor protein